jgi:hypothetical protein
VGGDPWRPDPRTLTRPREQLCQRVVAERLQPPPAAAADQKQIGRLGAGRTLAHDVVADRGERRRLVEIDDALAPRLGAHALEMIIATAHHDAATAIGDVLQADTERLARTHASRCAAWARTP